MSKAFTKDDAADDTPIVPPRAPLPAGVPNYVTPRGLERLRSERVALEHERVAHEGEDPAERTARLAVLNLRLIELDARIASAELVEPPMEPPERVRFGASVRVRYGSGKEAEYRIVGVDEADAGAKSIAFCSPLARALLGKRVAEFAELQTPRDCEELEILGIDYPARHLTPDSR